MNSRALVKNVERSIKTIRNFDVKRVTDDGEIIYKPEDEKINIYYCQTGDDIKDGYIMIIGSTGTAYAHAPMFYHVTLPDEYPFINPKCQFISTVGTRLHPNMYNCGKVCLSILGTWQGESWTPTMGIDTLALQLLALLSHDHPLRCEPGYERGRDDKVEHYTDFVKAACVVKCIPQFFKEPPINDENVRKYFQNILLKQYLPKNIDKMEEYINNLVDDLKDKNLSNTSYDRCRLTYNREVADYVIGFLRGLLE